MYYFAKFRRRNLAYGALLLVSRPVFTNIEQSVVDVGFRKFYFQCESAYFQKKNFEIFISKQKFEINL